MAWLGVASAHCSCSYKFATLSMLLPFPVSISVEEVITALSSFHQALKGLYNFKMFLSYAVTLVCAVFPCTYIIEPQIPNGHPVVVTNSEDSWTPATNFPTNISSKIFKIYSQTTLDRHPELLQKDQPLDPSEELKNDVKVKKSPMAWTKNGVLKGTILKSISDRDYAAFKSIPYAQPPVGNLRFRPPVKANPWGGILDATQDAPTCIQNDFIQQYKLIGQEDCLYLNVFTPKGQKYSRNEKNQLPVMVWIHGGGWFFSTSSYYGASYLMDEDVVLVTINYRLSMLGFLSTGDEASPGNNGLKDQVLALNWVKENIASFGGDPNRVTIFGESAGAGSVHLHMLSPLSRGLFHGAISQSGCATCFWSLSERAPEIAAKFGALLNCTGSSYDLVNCLRTKDAAQLVTTQLFLLEWTMYPVVIFGPVLEPTHAGAYLDELPEDIYRRGGAADVPWISGFNSEEGAINIAALIINNKTSSELNTNWEKYAPILLDLKDSEDNAVELSNEIRQRYLGSEGVTFGTRYKAIQMFEDRYMISCGVRGIQMHATYGNSPVYAYRLSYRGKYSIVQVVGQNSEDWGVSHLDDLIYLFNNTNYYQTLSLDDEEYQMSKLMTGIWSSFAKTGKPLVRGNTPGSNNFKDEGSDVWFPVTKENADDASLNFKVNFLDLNLDPYMIEDPYYERVQFWKNLNLKDF